MLDALDTAVPSEAQLTTAAQATTDAAVLQTRSLPQGDLYDPLMARQALPHWQDIAERCLACGNCLGMSHLFLP